MSLRGIWNAMLGKTTIGDAESDRKFYERLAAFQAVVDNNTEGLREEHRQINAKLDEQTAKLNEIFDDLSKDDDTRG